MRRFKGFRGVGGGGGWGGGRDWGGGGWGIRGMKKGFLLSQY